jgi:hypothetical protein
MVIRLGVKGSQVRAFDWPSVRADIEAAMASPLDPLEVPSDDLGVLASDATGGITVGLPWERLTDERLEALIFDLIRSYPNHSNVQWLMRTNAPDRGRDISFDRRLQFDTGSVRNERVIVQAKHWQSKSVAVADVTALLEQVSLWEPPTVHAVVIATTGRFTSDAVKLAESHNDGGKRPSLELWPDSQLETLLSQRPGIAASYGLR